jgi:short-subunit dehydrogenase
MASVLIIGATSDIARALAHHFAGASYDVVLAVRNLDDVGPDLSDLRIRYNVNTRAVRLDVTEAASHAEWYRALEPAPDVTVCVAGYMGEQERSQRDTAEAKKVLDTNFTGCALLLEIVAADYEMKKEGAIIGVASVAGLRGRKSNYLYGSAKAGFIAYLSGLRNRLDGAGVRVLTVLPGFVDTRMTEGLPLPGPLVATPRQAAGDIFKAFRKKKSVVYTRWFWRWIMLIIRMIPEQVFKKLNPSRSLRN